ncbi:MAG: rhomboid family intramembrane serine protease [Saprospiraceae bacterium]
MAVTHIIIAFTALFSIWGFSNQDIFYKCMHRPHDEARRGEYYRWLTGGFLHGDYMHLIFNMFTLYAFGPVVEKWFGVHFGMTGPLFFVIFYLISIVAASLATYFKFKDSPGFASVGASGAVSAVLFAAVLLHPTMGLYLMFIPIPIPGFIFAGLYLWYSSYAARRGNDGIDHTAHFYGAVFGFIFPMVFDPFLLMDFVAQLALWFSMQFS